MVLGGLKSDLAGVEVQEHVILDSAAALIAVGPS